MAENTETVSQLLKVAKTYRKKSTRKSRWAVKNSLRSIRRKRSKTRYYKSLRQQRYNRKTDELCSAVRGFDICDMDWAPSTSSATLPPEVTEWEEKSEIAYWKSRAISLELENKMLHQHLRDVYAKAIEDRARYKEYAQDNNPENTDIDTTNLENGNFENSNLEDGYFEESTSKGTRQERKEKNKHKRQRKKKESSQENAEGAKKINVEATPLVVPREPEGKNRLEELKKIYGETAPKIMGMETALQLSFERIKNKSHPPYWPSIPLRLSFE